MDLASYVRLPVLPEKIPVHECLELFLLSTRTLAEGLAELQATLKPGNRPNS